MSQPSNNIVVANWKMNLTSLQSRELAASFVSLSASLDRSEVWIAPSFTALGSVNEVVRNTPIRLGVQNIHWDLLGAFTGEVSAPMILEHGGSFAIIGHSERRNVFGESDTMIARRVSRCIESSLTALLCIGETLEEREKGITHEVLKRQLSSAISQIAKSEDSSSGPLKVPPSGRKPLVLAYEPVWAIGTGKVASTLEIADAHGFILETIASLGFPSNTPVLYGGSVTPDNFSEIIALDDVSGALVGGASLSRDKFSKLVETAELA